MVVDADQLEDVARTALATGQEEAALARLQPAAEMARSARLWQFTGLLQRSLDDHAVAFASFTEAARLAPDDAAIAHGLARVALEAGLDAVATFERAQGLDPGNGAVLLGLVAAKLAVGSGVEAEAQLKAALVRVPLWIDGHVQLAQLRSILGKRDQSSALLESALEAHPTEPSLWLALFNLRVSQGEFASLDKALQHARQAGMPENQLSRFDAIGAAEQGQEERADSLFGQLPFSDRQEIAVWHVRHLLRTGRLAQALGVIDHGIEGERASQFWPYASIAWRLANDPRRSWLEADERLVSTLDLTNHLPPLEKLTDVLRSLHAASGEYLDQSVRGGTQTDGPLLSRIEPEIRQLRAAIVTAVRRYLAQLPPPDPLHPLLKERRDGRIRFSGSWSVRLRGAGYHANHVHPEGWISSALYIALPDRVETDAAKAGWLKIGEAPRELGIDMSSQLIEPTTGHLVLFPSWMWHGTEPFLQGERLTVAFDVRHPF